MESRPTELEPVSSIEIRPVESTDIALLEAALPSPDGAHFHQDRLDRQLRDESTYLVAWRNGVPVGNLDLRWTGSNQPEVASKISDCPELNAIEVHPDMRSQGIGKQLIEAAEDMARTRGYQQVGLGVDVTNPRAQALYERLGYKDWGQGIYRDRWTEHRSDGDIDHAEECHWLTKEL